MVKNLPDSTGDVSDVGLITGSGRSPGGEHGNPLQYPCLENPTNRGVWWAIIHKVTNSQTGLKQLSMHTHICVCVCVCIMPFFVACNSFLLKVYFV